MGAEFANSPLRVAPPVKRRLDAMRDEKMQRVGRLVTISEVIEDLIREHDAAIEVRPV